MCTRPGTHHTTNKQTDIRYMPASVASSARDQSLNQIGGAPVQ